MLMYPLAFLLLSQIAVAVDPESANVIAFGGPDDNTLFVADSKQATIHAYDNVADTTYVEAFGSYNVPDLEWDIAEKLGTTDRSIVIKDLAIHPLTKAAYIAVHRLDKSGFVPVIVVVLNNGHMRVMDLRDPHTSHKFDDQLEADFKFWNKTPVRSFTFTDMEFFEGQLYIAGLSNGDFASTLRIVDYPFGDDVVKTTVEIYHANHDQRETRAPIRTMKIVTIEGTKYLIAAYTCTPLVVFKLEDIKKGGHQTGITIGELGFGNTPIDIIEFVANDMEQNAFNVLLLNNKNQSPQIIQFSDIEQALGGKGLKSFAGFKRAGLPTQDVPMTNLLHIDNQDDMRIAAIRRDPDTGYVELVTFLKNMYFRLSDFQSEFEWPNYEYPDLPSMAFIKGVHMMLKSEEGFGGGKK